MGSTGIHDAGSVVKMILAGAKVTEVCSVLYKQGIPYLQKLVSGLNDWMDKNGIKNLDEVRGKLSYKNLPDPAFYERAQFMKYFSEVH